MWSVIVYWGISYLNLFILHMYIHETVPVSCFPYFSTLSRLVLKLPWHWWRQEVPYHASHFQVWGKNCRKGSGGVVWNAISRRYGDDICVDTLLPLSHTHRHAHACTHTYTRTHTHTHTHTHTNTTHSGSCLELTKLWIFTKMAVNIHKNDCEYSQKWLWIFTKCEYLLCPGQVFTLTGFFLVLYQPTSASHFVMVQELVWGLCAFLVAVQQSENTNQIAECRLKLR